MPTRWRKPVLLSVAGLTLGVVGVGVASVAYILPRLDLKEYAPRSETRPKARLRSAERIPQLESHTCGFLALSAAYTAYGLSPQDKNLRVRLGVDTVAHPFDSSSRGTLHPDLFRVLDQDGFAFELIDPDEPGADALLVEHLHENNPALVLIRRRATGGLHWVLADAMESPTEVRIVDSLEPEPVVEPLNAYLQQSVLSVVAIRPARTDTPVAGNDQNFNALYALGLDEMRRVRTRMLARSEE